MRWDKIIIGGGLYGLYSALLCGKHGQTVLVLEYDDQPFKRATYINQARVHQGYHYPRSFSTAIKSAYYFKRFNEDYGDCILSDFHKIYATSADFSWTSADQFKKFSKAAGIRCDEIGVETYFKPGKCDGAFVTNEYTYDAKLLCEKILKEIDQYPQISIVFHSRIQAIVNDGLNYVITMEDGMNYKSGFVLNTTYASVNQVNRKAGFEPFKIKYELCEIIICKVCEELKNVGITVMDGPFFSIMPFGKTGYHSLTAVTFTPHLTSHNDLPVFECQNRCTDEKWCSPMQLGNCNDCSAKPHTAWEYMSGLARKYLKEELKFDYVYSLFSMKPILRSSEIDDSRPTVIKEFTNAPRFISVLSGKINTVYDLDEVLLND